MARLCKAAIISIIVSLSIAGQVPETVKSQPLSNSTDSRSANNVDQQNVSARAFGAVCDGTHDDTRAIQAAIDSLPLVANTSHGILRSGAVELPYVAGRTRDNYPGCLISPPFLAASPYVTLWSKGGNAVLKAAPNSAPVMGRMTMTGASNTSPIVVTGTNNFSDGDTVVCQGVMGNLGANSWYGFRGTGPWTISSVTPTQFTLNDSSGTGVYTSGGTCFKGTERFMLTIINPNGVDSPNYNFNIGVENIIFDGSARGNQFVSGIMCNCSIATRLVRDYIMFGYRGLVTAPGGADNITGENLTFVPTFRDGPDPIGLFITRSSGTNSVSLTNLKFVGDYGGPDELPAYKARTPALVLGNDITNTHLDVMNFENVGWPISYGNFLYNVSTTHIVATCAGSACSFTDYPQVVTYDSSAQVLDTSGIRIEGIYLRYRCGQLIDGKCDSSLPAPLSPGDSAYYPIAYDSISSHTIMSELDVTGPRQRNVVPSGTGPFRSLVFQFDYHNILKDAAGIGAWFQGGSSWSAGQQTGIALQGTLSSGVLTTAAIFLPGGVQFWPRTTSMVVGAQLWKFQLGSGGADSNPSTQLFSSSSDGTHSHQYFQFGQANEGNLSGVGVVLDPNGTEGTGFGGGVRIPAIKSNSGTRYVCVDTTGLLISQTMPCSGT